MRESLELVVDILLGGDHIADHAENCLSSARRRFQILAGRFDGEMSFGESAVALFKSIAMIVVEPVQNAIAVSASAPGDLLADRVEFADDCWATPCQHKNDGDSPKPPEEIRACARILPPQAGEAETYNEHGRPPGEILQPWQEGAFDLILQERYESACTADQIVEELRQRAACQAGRRGRRRWAWRLSESRQARATGNRRDAQDR